MSRKIKQALQNIIERFKSGDIPKAIAYSTFPIPNIPAAKWSLLNRTFMFLANTTDARGYRQWQAVGRQVKKSSKAFIILAPRIVRKKPENDEEEDEKILMGFLAVPVFRVQDTEGKPLDYQEIKLPDHPFMDVANSWGISVRAIPGNYRYYGYFSQERKEIALVTKEESVFFHELSHAAHEKILGKLKPGQDWKQEIVAELSATVLCLLVGKTPKYLGNSYQYIEGYAKKAKLEAIQACLRVISDVEKVLNLIIKPTSSRPNSSKNLSN